MRVRVKERNEHRIEFNTNTDETSKLSVRTYVCVCVCVKRSRCTCIWNVQGEHRSMYAYAYAYVYVCVIQRAAEIFEPNKISRNINFVLAPIPTDSRHIVRKLIYYHGTMSVIVFVVVVSFSLCLFFSLSLSHFQSFSEAFVAVAAAVTQSERYLYDMVCYMYNNSIPWIYR